MDEDQNKLLEELRNKFIQLFIEEYNKRLSHSGKTQLDIVDEANLLLSSHKSEVDYLSLCYQGIPEFEEEIVNQIKTGIIIGENSRYEIANERKMKKQREEFYKEFYDFMNNIYPLEKEKNSHKI